MTKTVSDLRVRLQVESIRPNENIRNSLSSVIFYKSS